MVPAEVITLLLSGCGAGMINAVAGGGTLITFPALILFGMNPVTANATSTLALVVGTSGSLYGFRSRLIQVRYWFMTFAPVSVAGGWLGGFFLTHGRESTFSRLVPYLVLFATLLFMLQGFMSKHVARQVALAKAASPVRRHIVIAMIFQFVVAIYGGYFGAGIGILMLASLGFLGFCDIHEMNTLKNVLGSLINLVAALWFTVNGLINWPHMAVMTVGAVAGYYLGSTYSQRLGQSHVRYLITAIGIIITAVMFWKLH